MISLGDQLRCPTNGGCQERDLVHETFINRHGRVLDDRRHYRDPRRSAEIANRLVLVVGIDDLHREGPSLGLLLDELDGCHSGVRRQFLALLAEESDFPELHTQFGDACDCFAKDVETLSRLETPEEYQLSGLDEIAVLVSGPLLFHAQVLQIDDIRLHEGAVRRETVALLFHEGKQVSAAAYDDIGKFDNTSFGIHTGEFRFIAEGQHSIVPVPDIRRGGLHHKQRTFERKTKPLGKQRIVGASAPLGCVHDVVRLLALQPAIELVHLPLPARGRADQLQWFRRQWNEPDVETSIEFYPMLYGFVLALRAFEIEHGDHVSIRDQGACEMIVGRGDAAVAHRAKYLLGSDANFQASPG